MPAHRSFDDVISARTICARHILQDPKAFARFEEAGGLASDLQAIVEAGERAERLDRAQGSLRADRRAKLVEVADRLEELKREHAAILRILRIVQKEVEQEDGLREARTAASAVLADGRAVRVRPVGQAGPDGRRRYRSRSRYVLQQEIKNDATSLLQHTELHERLARRRVSVARLEALRDAAAALERALLEGTVSKGDAKGATIEERAAVKEQKRLWAACYPLLRAAGRADERLARMLRAAAGR